MTKVKVVTLSTLNSLIKKEEDFSNQQKALLIVKAGLKSLGDDNFTEEQLRNVVGIRKIAEEAAASEAAELGIDPLFETYENLASAIENTIDLCLTDDEEVSEPETAEDLEEELEEETVEEDTEENSEEEEEEEEGIITKDDDEDDVEEEDIVGSDEESE